FSPSSPVSASCCTSSTCLSCRCCWKAAAPPCRRGRWCRICAQSRYVSARRSTRTSLSTKAKAKKPKIGSLTLCTTMSRDWADLVPESCPPKPKPNHGHGARHHRGTFFLGEFGHEIRGPPIFTSIGDLDAHLYLHWHLV